MFIKKNISTIIFILFLLIIIVQDLFSISNQTATFDEPNHLVRGYMPLITGDFRFNTGHPPLINMFSAIPLLFIKNINPSTENYGWKNIDIWQFSHYFLYLSGNDADKLIFYGRLPILILSLLLAFLIFKWTKEIYGRKAAFFAMFLYVFSPTIISSTTQITTDLGVTFFIFLSLYCFWRFAKEPTKKNLIFLLIVFGLAQVSKFSAVFLYPIFLLISITILIKNKQFLIPFSFIKKIKNLRLRNTTSILLFFTMLFIVSSIIIFAVYGFQFKTVASSIPSFEVEKVSSRLNKLPEGNFKNLVIDAVYNVPLPASPYLYGFFSTIYSFGGIDKTIYINGKVYSGGVLFFYFFAFLIKTPIPTLIFIFLSILFFKKIKSKNILDEHFFIIPAVSFIIIFSFLSKQSGIRYLLPIYPLIFVFVSKVINIKNIKMKNKIWTVFFVLLGIWYLIASLFICPNYIAYFNEFAGGPENGYKYLVGVNLDAGQELKNLKKYMDENNIKKIKLSYFGTVDPSYYRIDYEYLLSPESQQWVINFHLNNPNFISERCKNTKGIIAISATNLQNVFLSDKHCYDWLKNYKPIAKIGYSIFIYNIPNKY